MHKFSIDPQPKVIMAMLKTDFKCTDEYDPENEQTFEAFHTFMIMEYARHHKHNHAMVKSVGYGIANNLKTKSEEEKAAEDAAWAVA